MRCVDAAQIAHNYSMDYVGFKTMALTPMMQQYFDIKKKYADCILFFRLGDFYEMFFEDAETASKQLEITLTGRDCGMEKRAPMCGVPFHSADNYLARLVNKGFKVAICEQVEDASAAKGIVKRDVVRVVTPGTITDSKMLDEKSNNYIMSVYGKGFSYGLCVADISTGELMTAQITWGNTTGKLFDEIARFNPSEMIVNEDFYNSDLTGIINKRFKTYLSTVPGSSFETANAEKTIRSLFNDSEASILRDLDNIGLNAAGALIGYINHTQKANLKHIGKIESYNIEEYMMLDASTRRNLELTETLREKSRKGSLLWVLDKTVTSMGSRTLKKWIEQPLLKKQDICQRLEAVSELKEKFMLRAESRELLNNIYDIERLIGRVVMGSANCRDLTALKKSLGQLPHIKSILKDCLADLNQFIYNSIDPMSDICRLIESSIIDEPPVSVKEGGIIKDGYNENVDKLRTASREGKTWIAELEAKERKKTGIKNLKTGFNKVFGYYLEITKSNYSLVPGHYIRKQTLANNERYITPELKEIENTILGAEEKVVGLEYDLFIKVREDIAKETDRIKKTAGAVSTLDALVSLAEVADRELYERPEVTDGDEINIVNGRHPVVEKMIEKGTFVPNDTLMDLNENRLSIITGPNMAGKSTYMRETALICLMAQIGSFVPADSAIIGITDRIFTRVGASDDLASGQSTFMVEMSEVAHILKNATSRSLLILDEIGRGTSTYDGLSIAWAVIEYISDDKMLGARTLFATHYHELTELEGTLKGVKNYCITVEEKGDEIIFLRKIIRGGADDSYGIQVAQLAGVPQPVISRAKEILEELEDADISKGNKGIRKSKRPMEGQIELFAYGAKKDGGRDIIDSILHIDINTITPVEAINLLWKLKEKAKKT